MKAPQTLRARVALLALIVTGAWVSLLTIGFNLLLGAQLRNQADELLRSRVQAVAATIDLGPDNHLRIVDLQDDRAIDSGTWVYEGTAVVERPAHADDDLQGAVDALVTNGHRASSTAEERLYAEPVLRGGQQVGTVVAALSVDPYRRTEDLALVASVVLAALLLAGMYAMTSLAVSRALRPVREMTQQAARWSAAEQGRRFGSARRPRELDELAGTLDGLLDRLSAVLRHEQQLSGELSHELRTPLASIVGELDLLRSRPRSQRELDEAHAALAARAEQMSQILEVLLASARGAADRLPGRCDAEDVLGRFSDDLVQVDVGHVPVGVEAAVLERTLAPLVDNARRHAAGAVRVAASTRGGQVEVVVTDDGPGLPDGAHEEVFEPGRRADIDDGHGGAGLGLALARRLARANGGDVRADSVAVGARFVVTLPPG